MMFGPALPILLLAIPALVAVIVVLAGIFGAVASLFRRPVEQVPRAVAMPAPRREPVAARVPVAVRVPVAARVRAFTEDEATVVFDRAAVAR